MKDLAHNHVATYRAGSSGYAEHTGAARFTKRGLVTVEYDSKVWVYRKAGYMAGEWRKWLNSVFVPVCSEIRLNGQFPVYYVA